MKELIYNYLKSAGYIKESAGEKDYAHAHLDIDNFFDEANVELVISKQIK